MSWQHLLTFHITAMALDSENIKVFVGSMTFILVTPFAKIIIKLIIKLIIKTTYILAYNWTTCIIIALLDDQFF